MADAAEVTTGFPWLTEWAVDDPPPTLEYSYLPGDRWHSSGGIRRHLEFRDSGLAEATVGLIGAQHVKYIGIGTDDEDHGWHVHDLDWQFSILLAGSMKRATDEFGTLSVSAGDSTSYPGLCWHREWDFSTDWEMIAMRIPATTKTITGRDSELPERVATMDPNRAPIVSLDREESYRPGVGHEAEFEVRDLGAEQLTEGRLGLRIVRAAREGASSGPHYHSASTWFVVLGGAAAMRVADRPPVELGHLDAVSIGAGPDMRHAIRSAGRDFKLLEMTIPAKYETIELEAQGGIR